LKTVVGKGFLRLALMQELAGPKCLPKGVLRLKLRNDTKGKQVNILVLWVSLIVNCGNAFAGRIPYGWGQEEFSFLRKQLCTVP